jgi:hypothetical protein
MLTEGHPLSMTMGECTNTTLRSLNRAVVVTPADVAYSARRHVRRLDVQRGGCGMAGPVR